MVAMSPPHDPAKVLADLRAALAAPGLPQDEELPDSLASVALVVHMVEVEPALLCIERAANPRDPWSGHIGFPGGRAEEHDPSSRHTAERETLEEVGLALERHGEYLGPLSELRVMNRNGPAPFKLSPHVFFVQTLPELRLDAREVAAAHSVTLRHLLDPSHAIEKQITWKGEEYRMPGVRLGESILWGLSLRVWSDLETRLATTSLLGRLRLPPRRRRARPAT